MRMLGELTSLSRRLEKSLISEDVGGVDLSVEDLGKDLISEDVGEGPHK